RAMRRFLFLALLLSPALADAQSWSNILAASRAIDWTSNGLPATLPTGETTVNPWTPPARTQCGSTIAAGFAAAALNTALAACSPGTFVLLGPGTTTINNANITLYTQNGVTLRGSGGSSTIVKLIGTSQIRFGISWNNGSCIWASGFSVGTSSI